MRKAWVMVAVLGFGCAGTGEPEPPEPSVEAFIDSAAPRNAVSRAPTPAPATRPRSPEPLPQDDERWTSTHYNLTIEVDDPSEALVEARALFLRAGATIQSSNRQADSNSSINATMTSAQYQTLASKLEELPGKVMYENTSSNAMAPQTRQLRDRLALAHRADDLLTERTKHAQDEELDALMLLHELNMRERTNLESQIRSYWDQAGKTYVYLNFQKSQ